MLGSSCGHVSGAVMASRWLYLDADGFFASCEEAADPALYGRPVGVVAGEPYADAPLIAVNTVAKRAGVRSGDRVCDARALCPGFVVCPQRVERYVDVHGRMVAAVEGVLPVAAVHSIDELSARLCPRDDPRVLVAGVKSAVAAALTERVPVSVAVAPSAWLAKTAAEAHKPSAAVVWRRSDLPGVYAGLELEDLPGAGPRICKRLRSAGIGSVRALHDADRSRAIVAWGSIEGERVRLGLRGEDVPTPARVRRSVAHGRVLGRSGCWRGSRQVVRWLAVCALRRCVEGGQLPRRVAVEVATRAGEVRTGAELIPSSGHERELLRAVSALWDAAADARPHDGPARVGLVLDVLVDACAPQLFDVDPGERRLQRLLDSVRDHYAAPALVWGRCADPGGRYTGAKIAYQSFPDAARLRWLGVV